MREFTNGDRKWLVAWQSARCSPRVALEIIWLMNSVFISSILLSLCRGSAFDSAIQRLSIDLLQSFLNKQKQSLKQKKGFLGSPLTLYTFSHGEPTMDSDRREQFLQSTRNCFWSLYNVQYWVLQKDFNTSMPLWIFETLQQCQSYPCYCYHIYVESQSFTLGLQQKLTQTDSYRVSDFYFTFHNIAEGLPRVQLVHFNWTYITLILFNFPLF